MDAIIRSVFNDNIDNGVFFLQLYFIEIYGLKKGKTLVELH